MGTRRIAWIGGVVAALLTTVSGQQAPKPDFDTATLAWDRGDYVAALTAYKALLAAPGGEQWLEPIALQTGELFQTQEITPDGANPRFSPDGRFVVYETGSGAARLTRVVEPGAGMRIAAEVKGHSLVFLPQGDRFVYLKLEPSGELTNALADLDQAGQTPARFAAQQRLNWLQLKYVDIVTRNLSTGQERVCPTDGLLKSAVAPSADGRVIYVTGAWEDDPSRSDIYGVAADCDHPVAVTKEPGYKAGVLVDPKGVFLLYGMTAANPFARPAPAADGAAPGGGRGGGRGGRGAGGFGSSGSFAVHDLKTGATTIVDRDVAGAVRRRLDAGLSQQERRRDKRDGGCAGKSGRGRQEDPRPRECHRRVAGRLAHRAPVDAEGRLGDLRHRPRRLERNTRHAGDPARRVAPFRHQHPAARGDGRAAPPAVVTLRPADPAPHAPLPQQHGADHRAGIRLGHERRRTAGAGHRRTGRRHRVARTRHLPRHRSTGR